jgi:hypothetical protein
LACGKGFFTKYLTLVSLHALDTLIRRTYVRRERNTFCGVSAGLCHAGASHHPGNDLWWTGGKRGSMSLLQGKNIEQDSAQAGAPESRLGAGQRVRVGLTGLAAIFLLVLVAAAGLRPTETAAMSRAADEPLAVLGVAPGAGPAALPPATIAPPISDRPRRS